MTNWVVTRTDANGVQDMARCTSEDFARFTEERMVRDAITRGGTVRCRPPLAGGSPDISCPKCAETACECIWEP